MFFCLIAAKGEVSQSFVANTITKIHINFRDTLKIITEEEAMDLGIFSLT